MERLRRHRHVIVMAIACFWLGFTAGLLVSTRLGRSRTEVRT